MNNLSGAARRVTRNLDQFSVICVFGSVVGCVVLPLMIQVSYNIASLGCVRSSARGHVCIPVSLICQGYKILSVDSSHYESGALTTVDDSCTGMCDAVANLHPAN